MNGNRRRRSPEQPPSTSPSRRPAAARAGVRGDRGVSLIEMIVVVAIIGVAAMISVGYFSGLFKKNQLTTAAGDIRTFLQDASTEMQNRNLRVFVQVSRVAGRWHFEMIEDTTNDGAISAYGDVNARAAGKDTLLRVYDAPPSISLSGTDVARIDSAFWSVNSADSAARWVGVDYQKRAFNSTAGSQIGGIALLSVSHADMVSGNLTPQFVYRVRVNPVWDVTVRRG